MKIAIVSSSGPRLMELLQVREAWKNESVFFAVDKGYESLILLQTERVHFLRKGGPLPLASFLLNLWLSLRAFNKENPDIVVCNDAFLGYWFCLFARSRKKSVVFIAPFVRNKSPSFWEKQAYRMADLFLVQWQDLLDVLQSAEYSGSVL